MKILWLANVLPAFAAQTAGLEVTHGGGWLIGQLAALRPGADIEITYLAPHPGVPCPTPFSAAGVDFIAFPEKPVAYEAFFHQILKEKRPDAVHIHGTEFPHTLAMLKAGDPAKTLVSIQGLAGEYAKSYYADMPQKYHHASWLKRLGCRLSPVGGDVIALGQAAMATAGEIEQQALQMAEHVAGRTAWDKRCALAVNPELQYHHVGEILRPAFYVAEPWDIERCQKYSIFYSQATYPIKGLHVLLEQMSAILAKFPTAHLTVAGRAPYHLKNPIAQLPTDYLFEYQAYLKRRIRKLGLEQYVTFTGPLDEEAMCTAYKKAHLFVMASSIENSPNALGEAMMLGMPCVASNVGGVSSMLADGEEGRLFSFQAADTLAGHVIELFNDNMRSTTMGEKARAHALTTHAPQAVTAQLLKAYAAILEKA